MNELDPGGESLNFLAHNFEKQKKKIKNEKVFY